MPARRSQDKQGKRQPDNVFTGLVFNKEAVYVAIVMIIAKTRWDRTSVDVLVEPAPTIVADKDRAFWAHTTHVGGRFQFMLLLCDVVMIATCNIFGATEEQHF